MSSPKFVPVVTSYSNGLKSEDTRLNLSNQSNKGYVIKTITSAPLYRIVSYFTNLTEEGEAKVHDLDIPHSMYYTHIYLAWKSADQLMSSITLQADDSESKLNGANLVLSTSKLGDMYAPGRITSVLDFVTKCYEWAKPNTPPIPSSSAFISTLRVSATNEINRALIKYTAEQFLRATTHGSYHYVWERNSKMNVMFITCSQESKTLILPLRSVVYYKAVEFLTNKTYTNEVKVKLLPLSYESYYTHMYMAFKDADENISIVSLIGKTVESNISGVNLVLPMKKLDDMYAPYFISNVLNFVRKCYQKHSKNMVNTTYISIMRHADSVKTGREIIKSSSEHFKRHTPSGSLYLLWEMKSNSDRFLKSLNYRLLACGNNNDQIGLCDWRKIGLPSTEANDQCLYALDNKKNRNEKIIPPVSFKKIQMKNHEKQKSNITATVQLLFILYGMHHTIQKLEESHKQVDRNNELSNEKKNALKISIDLTKHLNRDE
ncbi:hypothetical protein Smp_173630 [Schistosoma mansoni]|uniref:hypothetical protein n=1 Tax=Schistosoma mansoni TaxID=6183 RepID=UPI00022DBECD|nr:hypothetical protein Smp_173630 [Schistosoma mansoni]|eukprot:XP_018648479.1 hypothetical protein Smp_173630 [Schistosoma mansoni]